MKRIIFIVTFSLCFLVLGDNREQYLQQQIETTKNNPTKENILSLMQNVVDNLRYSSLISQEERGLTNIALQEAVLLPNHAAFFAEEVRTEQAKVSHLPFNFNAERNKYDSLRHRYIVKTLIHLKSPDTIRVLGDFLYDDKDLPPQPTDVTANNGYALHTLKKIGLRNPAENHPYDDSPTCLKKWQSWYEKVKAGEITFSFEGQPHEYRFKPDGTWVTIPLPQSSDSKKPVANEAVPETQTSSQHDAQENNTFLSPWIYAGVAFLILLITFTARKIITGRSTSAQP